MARTDSIDQLGTYAAKRRKRTLTETAILNDGFGHSNGHGGYTARDALEIAARCEISVHALMPHLRTLVERCDVVELPGTGTYRRAS